MRSFLRHLAVGLLLLMPSASFAAVSITEIMYDLDGSDTDREWIELYNPGPEPVTIKGGTSGQDSWRIYHKTSGGTESNKTIAAEAFQGSMILASGEFAVVAQSGEKFKADHPGYTGTILISTALSLSNTSMTVGLRLGSAGTPWSVTEYSSTLGANDDGNSLQFGGVAWQPGVPTPGAAYPTETASAPEASAAEPHDEDVEETAAPAPAASSSSGKSTWTYTPQIYVSSLAPSRAVAGAPVTFDAAAVGLKKEPLPNARYVWSFGDGGVGEGKKVQHTYHYPAAYMVMVEASSGEWSATDRTEITVAAPEIVISGIKEGPYGFIELRNNGKSEVDLSGWLLGSGSGLFTVPQGTLIGAKKTVPFPSAITNLSADTTSTTLLYPNGNLVTRYQETIPAEPAPAVQLIVQAAVPEPKPVPVTAEPQEVRESTTVPASTSGSDEEPVRIASSSELIGAIGAAEENGFPWMLGALLLAAVSVGGYLTMLRPKTVPTAAEKLRTEASTYNIIEDGN